MSGYAHSEVVSCRVEVVITINFKARSSNGPYSLHIKLHKFDCVLALSGAGSVDDFEVRTGSRVVSRRLPGTGVGDTPIRAVERNSLRISHK